MYKIFNADTDKYLIGTSGYIRWTTEKNARIFKRREDIRNFLRYVDAIPTTWIVVSYDSIAIGSKKAQWVDKEGII